MKNIYLEILIFLQWQIEAENSLYFKSHNRENSPL